MIRKFIIASGDNSPISERITITPSSASDTYTVETASPVSWAIATNADIEVYVSRIYPDLSTGFEITYSGATPSVDFNVNVVYQ